MFTNGTLEVRKYSSEVFFSAPPKAEKMIDPTERFSARAADYVLGRPSYPAAAIDALFDGYGDPLALRVVDLGAGTGISSRLLAERAGTTIAIEPNAAMRESAAPYPRLEWRDARAEATGLPDGSVDLVTAFQSFHWFDAASALAEIERILRPGRRAALLYNERDERDAFTAAYGEIVRTYATDESEARRADARMTFLAYEGWKRVRFAPFANEQRLDRAALFARAGSTSYLPHEGEAARSLHEDLDALFQRFVRDGFVTMTMQCSVTLAETR